MVYFDNAATTFPKPASVLKEVNRCLNEYCGNPGRSSHKLSIKCAEEIYRAREAVADFLSFNEPENVVFTQNATYALNFAIKSCIPPGTHVLISSIEHNAVLRTVEKLRIKQNVSYSIFDAYNLESIKSLITHNTTAIICNLTSNVNGYSIDLHSLSNIATQNSLMLIVDASQAIGHYEINLSKTPCDVLCAPGHKGLFGIQGAGFAVFRESQIRDTLIEGGSGNASMSLFMPEYLPERYEAGTLPTPSIVSLRVGIDYIQSVGISEIENRTRFLTQKTLDVLRSYRKISLIDGKNGVISFNVRGKTPNEFARLLDDFSICTRAGLHCAPLAHKTLGTLPEGTIRISLSYLNSPEDIDVLNITLKTLL